MTPVRVGEERRTITARTKGALPSIDPLWLNQSAIRRREEGRKDEATRKDAVVIVVFIEVGGISGNKSEITPAFKLI